MKIETKQISAMIPSTQWSQSLSHQTSLLRKMIMSKKRKITGNSFVLRIWMD
jgi:hypothetical protein